MIELIKDKSIYLIALWPTPEATSSKEYMEAWAYNYRALQGFYELNLQICHDPKEAMNLHTLPSVAIQQKTKITTPIQDFEHPEKAVYYVGNSKHPVPSYWAETDHAVHIDQSTLLEHSLYGHQAAAIVLYDRYVKNADLQ